MSLFILVVSVIVFALDTAKLDSHLSENCFVVHILLLLSGSCFIYFHTSAWMIFY